MSSQNKTFYITTTLPYVNSEPHVGFAMEIIRADIIARHKKLNGFTVFFNTGTDEHGLKIYRKATEQGTDPQAYVNGFAEKFKELLPALHISDDITFIRTTDSHHKKAAQHFWDLCLAQGDIYKKAYKIKYCIGCELEKTDSELVDGKCPLHPTTDIEIIEEENYFFAFSKYQQPLLKLYAASPDLVVPDFRFNEIKAFVERGLEDFSISRLKSKMPWGVEVPHDPDHVMYVWFDALVNYISTLGWPENQTAFEQFWKSGTPVQYCGKDNLRQQSAMWQAMLMSAGLPQSHTIVIDGFIMSGGQKMSKSLGNVLSPFDIVREYGAEALRYYMAREISSFEDGDMTPESFKAAYNTGLANGLGNLTSRILKMSTTNGVVLEKEENAGTSELEAGVAQALETFNVKQAIDLIWAEMNALDSAIQVKQPFKLIKTDPEQAKADIRSLLSGLFIIARTLAPFMPQTSADIMRLIRENTMPDKPLFARKD